MFKILQTKMNYQFMCPELKCYDWIFKYSPCFPVDSQKVSIILDPPNFYNRLIERCEKAKKRIVWASLYIGNGYLEKNLLKTIENNMERNKDVKFKVLLDYQRGTRGEESSRSMLQGLLNRKPDQCCVALYHTPNLRGLFKMLLPQRWNELIGLQHMKVYISDNHVILSGANCSNDYFTNRQDRYIEIENEELANFYTSLIEKVSEFSVKCKANNVGVDDIPTLKGDKEEFIKKVKIEMNEFLNHWVDKQEVTIAKYRMGNNICGNTWVFPLIQMGELNVDQDVTVTKRLFSTAPPNSMLRIATGYFNLTTEYANIIVDKSKAMYTMLMAHPNANGFLGASGAAGRIPNAYSLIAKEFYKLFYVADETDRIRMYEYERPNWTFHAKGIWFYPYRCGLPWGTLIGSSNLGERSVRRDLETQIALFTIDPQLQRKLEHEYKELEVYSKDCVSELLLRDASLFVHLSVRYFRHFF